MVSERTDETSVQRKESAQSTGEFDPLASERNDIPAQVELVDDDELPAEKETPIVQRKESIQSTGEFDPLASERTDETSVQRKESIQSTGEFDPLASERTDETHANETPVVQRKESVQSTGEFDPLASERTDEKPVMKNPSALTDSIVLSDIPEDPTLFVEIPPVAASQSMLQPSEENSAELLRMTNSGRNMGGLQFTNESPTAPVVASDVTAIKRVDQVDPKTDVIKNDSIPECHKENPLLETTVIQLDTDIISKKLEQTADEEEEEEKKEYEVRRGCWGCRN